MSLALWARASGLEAPVRVGERWMSRDDAHRARGYVRHDGRWMTPAERDREAQARREREARDRDERARHDAEVRARETQSR